MKRKLSLILVICLLITSVDVISVRAQTGMLLSATANLIQQGALVGTQDSTGEEKQIRTIRKSKTAKEVLYEGIQSMATSIELTQYALTMDDLVALVGEVINESPEFFYIGNQVQAYQNSDSIITTYIPDYRYSNAQVKKMQAQLDEEVNLLLSQVSDTWSDREKALYVHDYLVSQFRYDKTYTRYDIYSLFVEGTAVCQGYTLAYNYIMQLLGIPCVAVPSDTMGHIWNQIQLDGKWYHVDLTYDDPLPDIAGVARHDNFLLSDTRISTQTNNEHEDWKSDYACTDTTYDNYFWTKSHAPFVYASSKWYYVNTPVGEGAGIYEWNPDTNGSTLVINLRGERWEISVGGYYSNLYTGLACYEDVVYYNTDTSIYGFKEEELPEERILSIQLAAGNKIWGIQIKDYQLTYSVGTDYNSVTGTPSALAFERPMVTETPSITPPVIPSETPAVTKKPEGTELPLATPSVTPSELPPATPSVTPQVIAPVTPTVTPSATIKPGTLVPDPIKKLEESRGDFADETVSSPVTSWGNTGSLGKNKIFVTARKGQKKIIVRVPKRVKTVVWVNKRIIRKKKGTVKKHTVLAKKNRTGKITLFLSKKLRKGMRIRVVIDVGDKKVRWEQKVKGGQYHD